MLWSKSFIPTLKVAPASLETPAAKLMLRAGLVRMLVAGVYSYLPLGLKVLYKIEEIIRKQMDSSGAQELLLPGLQPLELWQKTGRNAQMGETLIRFTDRRGRKLCLGPTHEEVITDLAKAYIHSYKQLPCILYQIQTKFRDELRPRFGLVRGCEFIMKDAYSFDRDEAALDKNYNLMLDVYRRIFKRCGLNFVITEADPGVMGGSVSNEFMAPTKDGEDKVMRCKACDFTRSLTDPNLQDLQNCPSCQGELEVISATEVGHIFKLGTKYTLAFEANYLDETGKRLPIIMGCYGIGVSRLIAAIIEQNHDEQGIIWPMTVCPYQVLIVPTNVSSELLRNNAIKIYEGLKKENIEVLLDDRDLHAGFKLKDADLTGIPIRITVGEEGLKKKSVEVMLRGSQQALFVKNALVIKRTKELIQKEIELLT